MEYRGKLEKVNLIGWWITGGLIGKLDEGEKIVCNLADAFLLESSWNGDSAFVQMREELVVERCSKISSIVTHEVPGGHRWFQRLTCLPKLKKLSLHYMPKLVSISSGVRIAPTLEWMSFYNCPSLQTLSDMEDIDLMTQLAEIGIQRLAPKQERKPSQQSGSDGSVKAPAVEEGTTLEEKQLYEPAPLSPFSIEEGGSIKAPAVDTGTASKEKQLSEPASLPFPTEGSDSMKAPAVEGRTTSEEKQLYEAVPFPFHREGGDSIKAPAEEAGTTLKETQLSKRVPSQRRKKLVLKMESLNDKIKNKAMKIVSRFPGVSSKYISPDGNDQNSTSKVSLASVPPTPRSEGDILQSPNLKNFTLAELKMATRNFRADGLLGEGALGRVFKGWIDEHSFAAGEPGTGVVIAVKCLKLKSLLGPKEWFAEINCLGQLYHPHIVKLIGFCSEDEHRLLVYEYMPRGSLGNHLFRREPLSGHIRLKVALGAAKRLAFLHSAEKQVIHRNFKTSNILLDSNYNAKVSGFGLARYGPTGDESHVSTRVMGTCGYIAPEYIATGRLTAKCDVYGFGVVLLEILSGQRAVDGNQPPGKQNLVVWAKPYLGNKRKIYRIMDNGLEGQYSLEGAHKAASLALQCLSTISQFRPRMTEVVAALEQLQDCEEPESTSSNSSDGAKHRRQSADDVRNEKHAAAAAAASFPQSTVDARRKKSVRTVGTHVLNPHSTPTTT
ncbi:probable serine/threonine-protein kinase PBL9 [Vitis riparia]|uniref:probable serine/threonine-protein kinase PBL9 n=1 Tax=Vitis riparia TaxID=96939 RepID=UPI00155ABB4B|nr:probable serine/threonine-protein kinase PBL9 [Vitis riparia]